MLRHHLDFQNQEIVNVNRKQLETKTHSGKQYTFTRPERVVYPERIQQQTVYPKPIYTVD